MDGADRVRAAEIDGRHDRPALVDLEHAGELAHAVDRRGAGGRRQRRRRDDGHPGPLAAGRLRVADEHSGHVSDRVQRPRLEPADGAGDARASGSPIGGVGAVPTSRRVVEQARRELVRARRRAASRDPRGRTARSAAGQRGWKRHPVGTAVASGSSPLSSSRSPPPPAEGTGIAVDERLRVRMLRALDDVHGRALLDDPAQVHHRDAVAQRPREAEVVRDEDEREVAAPLELDAGRRGSESAPRRRASRPARRRSGPSGSSTSAAAIATRWRWPPESWCG